MRFQVPPKTFRLGIVIPGSRISPNPGISGLKKLYFSVENSIIFHDICYKLEKNDFFSHTLTVTLLSPPATMLQAATAFLHSWLWAAMQQSSLAAAPTIRPNMRQPLTDIILMNAIKAEMALFDNTGKRDSLLVFIDSTSVEAERAFSAAEIFTTKLRSRLGDNSVDTLCFLRSFYLRAKPKCN